MKRRGFILLEVLVAAALMGLLLMISIMKFGDGTLRLQQQQLELAARRFIMEARRVQQQNMFATEGYSLKINMYGEKNYFTISGNGKTQKCSFEDEGCGDIVFENAGEILFNQSGSVSKSAYIHLYHRNNEALRITLNLQPVTGRLEIEP